MSIQRQITNHIAEDPRKSAAFYVRAFGMVVRFESDWFVHLAVEGQDGLELAFLLRDHELVRNVPGPPTTGQLLTLVVDDLDAVVEAAVSAGAELVEPARDLFYGQRRALIRDPDGTVVDLSTPCSPDPSWMSRVSEGEDGRFIEAPPVP